MLTSFKDLVFLVILASTFAVNATPKSAKMTWYNPKGVMSGTGLGACGKILDQSMPIAALSESYFNKYPGKPVPSYNNPLCGKEIKVSYGGKSVKVKVMDACATCQGPTDVDLSKSAFAKLADNSVGVLQGSWEFVNPKDDTVPVRRWSASHPLNKARRLLENVDGAEVATNVIERNEEVEMSSLG